MILEDQENTETMAREQKARISLLDCEIEDKKANLPRDFRDHLFEVARFST
jgi:hypothetical protein